MSYYPSKVIAYGFVTGSTGASTGRGAATARTSAGVYTITPDANVQHDHAEKVVHIQCQGAAGNVANVTTDTDTVTTVTTFSLPAGLAAGPVAADIDFFFQIEAFDPA